MQDVLMFWYDSVRLVTEEGKGTCRSCLFTRLSSYPPSLANKAHTPFVLKY